MQTIQLADTGRTTTRLGYGCSGLMGATGRKQSLALLEAAFDAGIRHFDVAPMYGFGEAEDCLGRFLQRHRDAVTVTTKFGIAPARNRSVLNVARHLASPLIRRLPALKKRLARTAEGIAGTGSRVRFRVQEARQSLETSLRLLRTDHIDLWLLHEATAEDLGDDTLLEFMQQQVRSGTVGTFGIGSHAAAIPELRLRRPAYCRVLQCEWSAVESPCTGQQNAFHIYHRALTDSFRSLHASLVADPALCGEWSRELQQPLQHASVLARLMLKAALECNPGSIVLFSSKSPEHMRGNVATCHDTSLESPALRLHQLLQKGAAGLSDRSLALPAGPLT